MGSLASQLGALEAFIEQFYPDCPSVTVISLDRRHEQQVPNEILVTDCNDKVVWHKARKTPDHFLRNHVLNSRSTVIGK